MLTIAELVEEVALCPIGMVILQVEQSEFF